METLDAWLARKREELTLLAGGLDPSPDVPLPAGVEAAIEAKFRLAAMLKARHVRTNWATTETHWHGDPLHCDPFAINYNYQRFDQTVTGPPVYDSVTARAGQAFVWTTYTSCGMSAITALALSLSRTTDATNIHVGAGAYFETLAIVQAYFANLRLLSDGAAVEPLPPLADAANALLIDSFAPRDWFVADAARAAGPIDLAIFDTTCFALSSGRIAAVLAWAFAEGVPLVMVRSHIKIDMLGSEYGRLGSAVFVLPRTVRRIGAIKLFQRLALGMRDAVRLTGAAALPLSLPPFLAAPSERRITRRRHARALANMRALIGALTRAGIDPDAFERYQHGLFCTIAPGPGTDRETARRLLMDLVARLQKAKVPARRAGSFGFDFIAVDEFCDVWRDREAVRLSIADLPGEMVGTLADCVIDWAGELGLVRQSVTMPG